MKSKKPQTQQQEQQSPWQKTQYTNLWRYVPSGTLYARMRVNGKLIVKSLKTDKIGVGKIRLAEMDKDERASAERDARTEAGDLTFGHALAIYRERLEADAELKPRTKDYYKERINALLKSWKQLPETNVRNIKAKDCSDWAGDFGKTRSATAYNNTLAVLKSVLDIAIELGARYENPAKDVARRSPKLKRLRLPTQEQFEQWLATMEKLGDGWCRASSILVRFLAYGGFRKGEAREIRWCDCDFQRGRIHVKGDPETRTKNGEERYVPMIPEMRNLLLEIRPEKVLPTMRVMSIHECQGTMDRARAKLLKDHKIEMSRITHHDLRHLFATRCIESGVDIPTVSKWLGHKDGGALAMKTYGHLRDEHSTDMAQRVVFSKAVNIVPMPTAAENRYTSDDIKEYAARTHPGLLDSPEQLISQK